MKKIYFASDFHFGIPDRRKSRIREDLFVQWLDQVAPDAAEIFLMGDLFDFWFEYRTVVPKGYIRLLGKIAQLTDAGIPVHLFKGNHDIWAFNYLNSEAGVELHRLPEIIERGGKRFFLAHGDGLGPGDQGYKMLKKVFENPFMQWSFRWIHPDWGTRIALYFSRRSRLANIAREGKKENGGSYEHEMLYKYSLRMLQEDDDVDFFIFGHRHRPIDIKLNQSTRCIILGDWVTNFSYGVFDGSDFTLKYFSRGGLT